MRCFVALLALFWSLVALAGPPEGAVSRGNSGEDIALEASGTWYGKWEEVWQYGTVTTRTVTTGAAQTFMEFSPNCKTRVSGFEASEPTATNNFYSARPTAKCYRVRIEDRSGAPNTITFVQGTAWS